MEVGEVLVALVVVVTIGCTWWSWHYQKVISAMFEGGPSAGAAASDERPTDQATPPVKLDQIEPFDGQPTSSVLGWEAFTIASTLLLDGTVLVSCTRQSDDPASRVRRSHNDGSLVLLIGDDDRARQAFHLIEDWRAAGTTLRLRPTTMATAIELYDRCDNALRACLLAT